MQRGSVGAGRVLFFWDQNTMNRNRLLTLAILLAAAGIVAFTIIRTRTSDVASREPSKPVPVIQTSDARPCFSVPVTSLNPGPCSFPVLFDRAGTFTAIATLDGISFACAIICLSPVALPVAPARRCCDLSMRAKCSSGRNWSLGRREPGRSVRAGALGEGVAQTESRKKRTRRLAQVSHFTS